MDVLDAAHAIVERLEAMLVASPPPGVDAAYAQDFFARRRVSVQAQIAEALRPFLEPIDDRLDTANRHKWAGHTADTIRTWAGKASRAEQSWLLSRVLAHRPDLTAVVQELCDRYELDLGELTATSKTVYRLVPGVAGDRLVVYEADGVSGADLPDVIDRADFAGFARAAYWSDDASQALLTEVAGTWFAKHVSTSEPVQVDRAKHGQRLEELVQQTQLEGLVGDEEAERRLEFRVRLLEQAGAELGMGRKLHLPPPDPNLAVGPLALAELLDRDPPTSPGERTTANFEAIATLLSPPKPGDAASILRYTGWGGLSLEAAKTYLPPALVPDDKALIHEYYTPTKVASELARLLLPRIPHLPRHSSGDVLALEPSAGIGRLLNAASTPGFEALSWTALEYSPLAAALLRRARPELTVLNTSFEQWTVSTAGRLDGQLGLVLCNPPFGQRGAETAIDPDPTYREKRAYWYFLRRTLRLLAEGGVAAFIIPYGFMTGKPAQFVALREQVLRSHHLIAAFRLPSSIYPGAGIVTDLVLLESRGGTLPAVLDEDRFIVEGQYFSVTESHVLGTERGKDGDEDAYRYEVEGEFQGLPPNMVLRERCKTCQVERVSPELPRSVRAERQRLADLPEAVLGASLLGRRVAKYLDLIAERSLPSLAQARAQHRELLDDVIAFAASNRLDEITSYQDVDGVAALLSVWQPDGKIAETLAKAQQVAARYSGSDSIADTAAWLLRERGPFTETALREFRASLGFGNPDTATLEAELVRASFAKDWTDPPIWLAETDYYTGLVGERYGRAIVHKDDPLTAAQVNRLRSLIRFPSISEIDPSPRLTWMPLNLLRAWMSEVLGKPVAELERTAALLTYKGTPYAFLEKRIGGKNEESVLFGWINLDLQFFQPPYEKIVDDEGEEESSEEALERARMAYTAAKTLHFRNWLLEDQRRVDQVESSYVLASFVAPTFESAPLQIARWGSQIVLKPHQCAVVRRLVHHNGGLNAFDTGVGKTFSGIATMAIQRERGVCRRPLVVVPNTLVWKWYRDILRCLPDYRVVVVGANRKLNRAGVWVSGPDSQEDRELKWRRFQAGQYDCAIVPYSFFATIGLRHEAWKQFAESTPLLARKLQLDAREFAEIIERAQERERTGKAKEPPKVSDKRAIAIVGEDVWEEADLEQREVIRQHVAQDLLRESIEREKTLVALTEKLGGLSERNVALHREALEQFAAVRAADTASNAITFEEIGIDFLLIDEAQNFKNIWAVGQLEGGSPKYLGAIQSGSERGYQLAAYRHNLSKRLGTPGGTYLLSATPAKNSPIEYFTLINLVNELAWANVGIPTVEAFIDRYLLIERRDVVQPNMEIREQSVVSGFRNLLELRDVIFRYAEFKTAAEVGLKLPESKSSTMLVDMTMEQSNLYYKLADKYTAAVRSMAHGGKNAAKLKNQALSLLAKMQLATIHPALVEGPVTPAHYEFTQVSFNHPDLPQEEKERRLILIEMAGGNRKASGQKIDELFEEAKKNTEIVNDWELETSNLWNIAKRKWAKKKKLRTQFTYASAGKVADMHSPKLDLCVELIMTNPGCGQIVFCDNVAVHRWLLELLVEAGMPRERIAVINGEIAKDPVRRLAISDEFNGVPAVVAPDGTIEVEEIMPRYDVVIANQAAYEGIDLHRRTCTVYHLDLPWEPNTLRQRNGRAVRQGNLQSNVDIKVLMARRSLDVVRYEYILGKLRWMSDLIESADNALSNPAADNEIDSEAMVLFMTKDEESAKAAIAALKASQEMRRRKQIAGRAWRDFELLVSRVKSLRNSSLDSERKLIIEEEIKKLRRSIENIPEDVWPYSWVLAHLDRDIAIDHDLDINSVPIIDGWTLHGAVEIGKVQGLVYGWREFGTVEWHKRDMNDDSADFKQGLGQFLTLGYLPQEKHAHPSYPEEDLKGQILALFASVRSSGTFELLGLKICSANWRQRLKAWWPEIVQMVKGTALDFLVPIRVGSGFDLVDSYNPKVTIDTLADFDLKTYTEFYRFVTSTRTDLTYSNVALTVEQWWGVRFPRGVLLSSSVRYANSVTGKRVSAVPLLASADLAVVQDDGFPDMPFLLIHLPSGSILRAFRTLDIARLAHDLVLGRQDWSSELAPFEQKEMVQTVLERLAARSEVPSDDELRIWGVR